MKIKTANLTGAALDWAVAKCDQPVYSDKALVASVKGGTDGIGIEHEPFNPSTDWTQGGHFVEREGIGILFDAGSACSKPSWFATPHDQCTTSSYEGEQFDPSFMVDEAAGVRGPTPLIAAMRCYVASKLGDEVEIPEELK